MTVEWIKYAVHIMYWYQANYYIWILGDFDFRKTTNYHMILQKI